MNQKDKFEMAMYVLVVATVLNFSVQSNVKPDSTIEFVFSVINACALLWFFYQYVKYTNDAGDDDDHNNLGV